MNKEIKITAEDLMWYPGENADTHYEWVQQRVALRNFYKGLRECSPDEIRRIDEALEPYFICRGGMKTKDWIAYCLQCGIIDNAPNGATVEAYARKHKQENPEHMVLVGQFVG